MNNLRFVIIILLLSYLTYSYSNNLQQEIIAKAYNFIIINKEKEAFELINQNANIDNPQIINFKGICFMNGWGITQNMDSAIINFEIAAIHGYSEAILNIESIYLDKNNKNKDFNKLFLFLDKGKKYDNPVINFKIGYYYYKGIGVTQSYEDAVIYFRKASIKGDINADYFLGICYKNGYGVEKNIAESNRYLQKSFENGSFYAYEELYDSYAENEVAEIYRDNIKKNVKKRSPGYNNNSSGIYKGYINVFDFSKKYILKTFDIKGIFELEEDKMELEFLDDAGEVLNIKHVKVSNNTTILPKTKITIKDHFYKNKLLNLNIDSITMIDSEFTNNIEGQFHVSNNNQEAYKPLFFRLIKHDNNADVLDKEIEDIRILPNPIEEDLNIHLNLYNSENVSLIISKSNGEIVFKENKILMAGNNLITHKLEISSGIYILNIIKESGNISKRIIKK